MSDAVNGIFVTLFELTSLVCPVVAGWLASHLGFARMMDILLLITSVMGVVYLGSTFYDLRQERLKPRASAEEKPLVNRRDCE